MVAVDVDVDSIVVTSYIVPHDNIEMDSKDLPRQAGRTVVVTGANSGIGLAAARELGVPARASCWRCATRPRPRRRAPRSRATTEVRKLDLADLASVHAFADGWEGDIDVLINNAGVMAVPEARTADGFEMQIGTNHLGHFALTEPAAAA